MVAFRLRIFFFLRLPHSPPKFCLPPKKFRSGYVPERHGHIFLNDVIFAMKSQAVQSLYITLLF